MPCAGVQLLLDRVWVRGMGLDDHRVLLGDVWILPPLQRILPYCPQLPQASAVPREASRRPWHQKCALLTALNGRLALKCTADNHVSSLITSRCSIHWTQHPHYIGIRAVCGKIAKRPKLHILQGLRLGIWMWICGVS